MYSVLDYGGMAADPVRMDAYARAIARTVKPGNVVLDLGCGTGIFTLLALRAGAARVHAVDLNPAIFLLPEIARENGVADKVIIHHVSSLELEPPEPVDVVVSDMRASSPLHGDHLAAVRDARRRWLAPGGVMIPSSDRLFVGAVESTGLAGHLARGWEGIENMGFSARAARTSVLNTVYDDRAASLIASDVITTSASWASLDYAACEDDSLCGAVELTNVRTGTAHGLAVWFEATVHDDIRYQTGPGWALAYARSFLPLLEPIRMQEGDRLRITLRAGIRGDRWAWETQRVDRDGEAGRLQRQATFFGMPSDPLALLRESSTFQPTLSAKGARIRDILARMNATRTTADLQRELEAACADVDKRTVAADVREAVRRYAR